MYKPAERKMNNKLDACSLIKRTKKQLSILKSTQGISHSLAGNGWTDISNCSVVLLLLRLLFYL